MAEKKMVIVKRIKDASRFGSDEFLHFSYWALDNAISKESKLSELHSKDEARSALGQGLKVIAVSSIDFCVPFFVADAKEGGQYYVAGGFISVKVSPRGKFYDWVVRELQMGKMSLDEGDLCREIYTRYGLGNYLNDLINSEKVQSLIQYGVAATEFRDIPTYLPEWCDFERIDSFRLVDTRGEVVPTTIIAAKNAMEKALDGGAIENLNEMIREGAKEVGKSWLRKIFKTLSEKPLTVLAGAVAVVVSMYLIKGCFSEISKERQLRDVEHGKKIAMSESTRWVDGSISLLFSGENASARKVLEHDAEMFLIDLFKVEAKGLKVWRNGALIDLPADKWERIIAEVMKFAAESNGDYDCNTEDEREIKLIANTDNVHLYDFDVEALRADAGLLSEIEKTFGVGFAGSTVLGGVPVRESVKSNALKSLSGKKFRIEVADTKIVFLPDLSALASDSGLPAGLSYDELVKKADSFWERAQSRFDDFPKSAKLFAERFAPLDKRCTSGFAEVESALKDLLDDIASKESDARMFLGQCGAKWLQYSEKMPADKGQKVRLVRESLEKMKSLRASVTARYDRIAFDKDIAAFNTASKSLLEWGANMIKCYNAQQARIGDVMRLKQDIFLAKETRDYAKIASFKTRLENFERIRLAQRKYEMDVGRYVESVCMKEYFDQTFGKGWIRQMNRKYGLKISVAANESMVKSADFTREIVRLYQGRDLDRSLEKGTMLSQAVIDNHREARDGKTVSEMGNEVAALYEVRKSILVLERIQRKSQNR